MKKYFSVIIFTILILIIPTISNAESITTGKFKYMPAFQNETEEVYYYSDNYFKESSKTYNEHLLAMSYNFALSTFEIRGFSYSKELLNGLDFKDFKAFDMEEKPTLDTVGMVIAHKEVDGKNLIAIAVRGEKYDSEWGNNFIVGKSGNAKGFNDSSIKVIDRIKGYIEKNNLKNNKIWMTGYSRAGTISNLVGVYINNHLDEFYTSEDDTYIYTFEAPSASTDKTIYDNIYSIKSVNDLIPFVYPKEWGFYNNGKEISIGDSKTIKTYIGLTEQEEYNDIEMNEFYSQFFKWLTSRLDRNTYSEYLEEPISQLFDIYFSKSSEDREKLKNFIVEDVKSALIDNQDNFSKIKPKAWAVMGHNSDYLYQSLSNDIIEILNSVRNTSNGLVLTEEEYNTIINYIYPILRVLGPIITDDSNYYDNIDYNYFYTKEAEDYLLSDEEMGKKYGLLDGKDYGYDDGLYGNPKNENSYATDSEYGPIYDEAYKNSYIEAYLEYYELGLKHKNDLSARGSYDGAKYSYNTGYEKGSYGDECIPYDDYLHIEEWMTEEYLNAYNEAYQEEYLKGYSDGLKNPISSEENTEPEQKNLYHFASLFKNVSHIMEMHHPQENLKLVQAVDSYYTPYEFTEGANQTICVEDTSITFKTSGSLDKFVKVQVDDKDLDENDYELKSGSTIITLKNEFIKTLGAGEHSLKVFYIDNTIGTNFKINKSEVVDQQADITNTDVPDNNNEFTYTKHTNPKTGDDIGIWVSLEIISIIGIIIIITKIRKYSFKQAKK